MAGVKKVYFGTNTKMYKTLAETVRYLDELCRLTEDIPKELFDLFVIPSFVALDQAKQVLSKKRVKLGAQNMHWEASGQFTGEISPVMLKEIGVDIIEIGHSERRHVFHESDRDINRKVIAALNHGFTALICVGEKLEHKETHSSDEWLGYQLKMALAGVKKKDVRNIWIAYEPVWAIGVNGIPARTDYVDKRHRSIKKVLNEIFSQEGKVVPVLYGGSVNLENATSLIQMPNVDGLFIGRSAWDAKNFNKIIRQVLSLSN